MGQWIDFKDLRARVSLEDVIVRYYRIATLRQDGRRLVGPCPVHGGDSPRAFHADLDKNVWHCFSKCQKGGNQLDFVAMKEGIGIREAALRLQEFLLGPGAAPPPPPSAPHALPRPKDAPDSSAAAAPTATIEKPVPGGDEGNPVINIRLDLKGDHPHLTQERNLLPETIEHFGIGWCGRGIMRGTIAIPLHDEDGDLVGYAGRRLKPSEIRDYGKYKLPKGFKKERVLYNFHRAKAHAADRGLILVEGFFDAIKLHEAGFPNAVAAMGCELSDYQVKLLAASKDVILLFDGDEPGRIGAEAARTKLAGRVHVRLAQLPDGTEPECLAPRVLRWVINGLQSLDLAEVTFRLPESAPPVAG